MLRSCFLGVISALSFAPFNVFPIFLITFARLFVKIYEIKETKPLLAEAFCFFFGLHVGCLYWVAYPLTLDFEKHGILIPFAVTLIPAYLSLFLLVPTFFLQKKAVGDFWKPAAFATSFCLTMMLYGNFFPGFPWVLPGYIWCCHEIFLQTLSLYGIYGLSFVTLLISGFLGLAFRCHKSHDFKKSKIAALISVLIFSLAVLFGWYRLANNPVKFTDKKVRTIQADISQKNKNDHKLSFSNLIEHIKLSLHDSPIDLIIWPEASVPYLYKEDFRQLHDHLKSFLHKGECLLAGVVRQGLSDGKIYNSVVAIDHDGKNIATFDKRRLLPFGEYVPFREYIPFESIAGDIGDFCVGEKTNISVINGIKIAFAICYEIVFPNNFVPGEADVIVNVTNDGWFGFTTEPFQHLQISRARAIENGVPLLRVTNYGISAIFDSFGREIARVPINQSGVTDTNIPRKADAIF